MDCVRCSTGKMISSVDRVICSWNWCHGVDEITGVVTTLWASERSWCEIGRECAFNQKIYLKFCHVWMKREKKEAVSTSSHGKFIWMIPLKVYKIRINKYFLFVIIQDVSKRRGQLCLLIYLEPQMIRHTLGYPSIGTILCAECWCCLSSLLGWWAQSWMGHHSDIGYQHAGTHFDDFTGTIGRINPTWY